MSSSFTGKFAAVILSSGKKSKNFSAHPPEVKINTDSKL
jgi:hypothetical protein